MDSRQYSDVGTSNCKDGGGELILEDHDGAWLDVRKVNMILREPAVVRHELYNCNMILILVLEMVDFLVLLATDLEKAGFREMFTHIYNDFKGQVKKNKDQKCWIKLAIFQSQNEKLW